MTSDDLSKTYNSIEKSYTDSYSNYYKLNFWEFMPYISDGITPDFDKLKIGLEFYYPVYAMETADYDGDGKEEEISYSVAHDEYGKKILLQKPFKAFII